LKSEKTDAFAGRLDESPKGIKPRWGRPAKKSRSKQPVLWISSLILCQWRDIGFAGGYRAFAKQADNETNVAAGKRMQGFCF